MSFRSPASAQSNLSLPKDTIAGAVDLFLEGLTQVAALIAAGMLQAQLGMSLMVIKISIVRRYLLLRTQLGGGGGRRALFKAVANKIKMRLLKRERCLGSQ